MKVNIFWSVKNIEVNPNCKDGTEDYFANSTSATINVKVDGVSTQTLTGRLAGNIITIIKQILSVLMEALRNFFK